MTRESTDKLNNFVSTDSDVAIRVGHSNYPALHTELRFRMQRFPVASPALLQRFGTPCDPAERLRYPLLTREGAEMGRLV